MIEFNARRQGEFMRAFTALTAKERAVVARYRKWLDRLHRELNGKPLDMEEPRKVARRVGVPLNTLVAEGLRRVMQEFNDLGGVRFGKGRTKV